MPIVIKKGSDLTKKKKCKTKSMTKNASGESLPEVVDYSNIATDMTDVLDFKIYRVIKPNFYNNSTRINLIGDAFYRDEEGELQPDGHLPPEGIEKKDEKKKKVTVPQPKPSVNVRDLGFADILTRIKESERNTATVRSGHSITKFLTAPTLEETIVWAIKFVQANGESLILHVIDLYYQLKSFESNLEG